MIRAILLCLAIFPLLGSELFQVSTYQALLEGVYDGTTMYRELFNKGDFGLGTFNDIDGEMVALEGGTGFYQLADELTIKFPNTDTFKRAHL
jgi:acetolactate decarboxylase